MKRIVFVFLIVPALCFAQNKKSLSHFWDIPWGVSVVDAEAVFGERGFTSVREGDSLITRAVYEGKEAVIVLLFNTAGRFYCGNVIFPSSETAAIPMYENYRKVLFRRYGMPDTAVEYFESPYEKGDGKEIEAITQESAFYLTEWNFGDQCQASVSILPSLDVCLSFSNPVFTDSLIGKK